MSLAPILAAPFVVQAHLALALLALISGTGVLVTTKGTLLHRRLGTGFAATMMFTAATSLLITGLFPGHYSPIHILSIITLVGIPVAVWHRRRGNIRAHAAGMLLNYAGLVTAGFFTLLPPRILHAAVFGN